MNTVARTPASRAAQATACPWFPALAATTPAFRSFVREGCDAVRRAPRTLNEPVRWRFSALSQTGRPQRRVSVSEGNAGVTRAAPVST